MRKVLWEVPGLGWSIPSFSVALLLACLAALGLTVRRARREGIEPEVVFELAAWLMTGGFVGARVWFLMTHPASWHSFVDLIGIGQGGIVYYGCLIGGLIGSLLYWFRNPFPFLAMADVVAPALAIGSAVGRVGCLLAGCCFGAVTAGPWAMRFPAGSPPWTRHVHDGLIPISSPISLPVEPTQLLAVLDGLIILGLLSAYYPRRRRDGEVMALLMVTYPVTRYLIEILRDDEPRVVLGITGSQVVSLVLLLGGVVSWALLWRSPAGRYADHAGAIRSEPRRISAFRTDTTARPLDQVRA